MLLAIDTATRTASTALYDEAGILAEASWRSRNNQSCEMLPAIARLLAHAADGLDGVSAVAVAQGPGSFTGLRIGMSLAKGLCLARDLPIIAVPTLDAAAYAVGDPGGPVYAVLEAGRGRLCVARYRFDDGLPRREGEIALAAADAWLPSLDQPVLVAGEVSAELAERLLAHPEGEQIDIASLAGSMRRAGFLAELAWNRLQTGDVDDLDTLSPIYVQQPAVAAPTAAL